MRPVNLTTSDASGGVKVSSVCPLDIYLKPFQVTLHSVLTGAATYTAEYTEDDPFLSTFDPATAVWTPVTAMSGASANAEATLISPVRAVRLRQTAGAGSAVLQVIQAGVLG
jgi:hypothetical protein